MSASESSPLAANLQESIEHLIAETVRRSQTDHDEEQVRLRAALEQALSEMEESRAAIDRATETLRAALTGSRQVDMHSTFNVDQVVHESPTPTETVQSEPFPENSAAPLKGPHELDVIAHDVTIGIASSLQAMLRARPEVQSAQTREFVNGELRLHLLMDAGLDTTVLKEWIAEHNGRISTQTESVIELRFEG